MTLSRGASRCFNLLRSYLHGKDHCWPSQATLSARLHVDPRTIQRHLKELRAAGLVTSKQRGDGRSVLYTIVGADVGADVGAEPPQATKQHAGNQRDVRQNVGAETSHLSLEVNPEENQEYQSEFTGVEALTERAHFSSTETEAIERHIGGYEGFEATPEVIGRLERKAKFYGKSGFQVCAAIERAVRKVQGTSNAPQSLGWFVKVVETEFSSAAAPARSSISVGLPTCAGSQVPHKPPQRAEVPAVDFAASIAALARAKQIGRRA